MLRKLAAVFIAAILALAVEFQPAAARPATLEADPRIQALIEQITVNEVSQAINRISGETPVLVGEQKALLKDRYNAGTSIIQAAQYLYNEFAASGLEPSFHVWSQTYGYRNVLADQPGFAPESGVYLVTSHLDMFGTGYGADDNASGVAAVLIASQVLSQADFRSGIRYIAFTGEEAGLLGSTAYANQMAAQGADLRGVINLDMIAYNTPNSVPDLDLHVRADQTGDQNLAELFADVIQVYGINLSPQILPDGFNRSDHASFWLRGYAAVFGSEDLADTSPYYHKPTDRAETLDMAYATGFTQAAAATLAHLAGLAEQIYFPVISY